MEEKYSVSAIKKKSIYVKLDDYAYDNDIDNLRIEFNKFLQSN